MDIRSRGSPSIGVAALERPVVMAAQFTQKLEPLFTMKAAQEPTATGFAQLPVL